jgi:hypothetical protein
VNTFVLVIGYNVLKNTCIMIVLLAMSLLYRFLISGFRVYSLPIQRPPRLMFSSRMQSRLSSQLVQVWPFLSRRHSPRLGGLALHCALPSYGPRTISNSSKEGSNTPAPLTQARGHKSLTEASRNKLKHIRRNSEADPVFPSTIDSRDVVLDLLNNKSFQEWVANDLPPRVLNPDTEGGIDNIRAMIRSNTIGEAHEYGHEEPLHPWWLAPPRWSYCLLVDDICLRSLNRADGFGAVVKIVNLRFSESVVRVLQKDGKTARRTTPPGGRWVDVYKRL